MSPRLRRAAAPLLPLLLLLPLALGAQPYGNEWIAYDRPHYKLSVTLEGLYRLDSLDLAGILAEGGHDLAALDPREFQLWHMGSEQAIHVEGQDDGSFDGTDYLEFYGAPNQGDFDSLLYASASLMLHREISLITDTAAYFLTWTPGVAGRRLETRANDLAGAPAADAWLAWRAQNVYANFGQFVQGRDYSGVWSSAHEDGEGFTDPAFNKTTSTKTLATPSPYAPLASEARLEVVVVATGNDVHRTLLDVNGVNRADVTYGGFGVQRFATDIPALSSSTAVAVTAAGVGAADRQRYSLIRADYAREPLLSGLTRARFRANDVPAPARLLGIKGFTTSGVDPVLHDLSNGVRLIGQRVADSVYFHLDYDATGADLYLHSGASSQMRSLAGHRPVTFTDLSDPANQGDYLLVYHPSLRAGAFSDPVADYAAHRASAAGGGHDVLTLDVNELYDQFAYGIRRHPLAFRGLARYATEAFAEPARHLFLVGHGRLYNKYRNSNAEAAACLIPTYGEPGSDLLLAAPRGRTAPLLAVGRLAATTPAEVEGYLAKVQAFEANQQSALQTVANKHWMKNVLHFGGGITAFEQSTFRGYLAEYESLIEDTLYGAYVHGFYKNTTDAITEPSGERIDSLLAAGVSLMTFFGHSSFDVFDYNIGDPDEFPLDGRWPVLFSNGCVTGEIHNSRYSLSEQYVFSDAGSVAFIAASTFSFANGLHAFARVWYRNLASATYGEGLGETIRATAAELDGTVSSVTRLAMEHTTLHGDPALTLNPHPEPDYAIEAAYVDFNPELLSLAADSFDLHLQIFNLGRAADTAFFVSARRVKPDGSTEELLRRVDATAYRDTVRFRFATDPIGGVGLNLFDLRVDANGEVDELDEANNVLTVSVPVAADDALPVWPYDYAIVDASGETLKASTADPFAPLRTYVFQIDTTQSFNSPLKAERRVTQTGGVLEWPAPPVPWTDSTVYYWRVSLDTLYGNPFRWRQHSFVHHPSKAPGWNQSHYFQFLRDDYTSMTLDADREFRFADNVRILQFETGGAWFQVISYLDYNQQALSSCASEGFVVFVFNPTNGQQWTTYNAGGGIGRYGGVYCSGAPSQGFLQYKSNDPAQREALFRLLMDTVPNGHYVGLYTTLFEPNWAQLDTIRYPWMGDTLSLLDALAFYGATAVDSFGSIDYRPPYMFFGRKGFPGLAQEVVAETATTRINGTFEIPGFWREGFFVTPPIGPAESWDRLEWRSETVDPIAVDQQSVSVIGIGTDGVETVLAAGIRGGDSTLAWIDPALYPRLRLRLDAADDSLRTPTQLRHWRVRYQPVPEAALNPAARFSFNGDSVYQGETVNLELAIDNVSDWSMDSLLVRFELIDANNIRHPLPYPRQDSLRHGDRLVSTVSFNSLDYPAGNAVLSVDVNPDADQPEQYRFNNVGLIPFRIVADERNPFLDVTFDGVRILDGDLVSAEPDILIRLTDENPILALADTSVLEVRLQYPDGAIRRVGYDNAELRFTPADAGALEDGNRAEILFTPDLVTDGRYTLIVTGQDVSGNAAGEIEYRVGFEVINEAMISNVLTYPNPFTTQTQFVFTLTGREVPDDLRIRIMTISGKVIREIRREELGPVRIGLNRTEYRWDGTDRYGDPVGNGLYLYRVVARMDGEALEHYGTGADRWFNEAGWGKMYLAR